MSQKYAFLFGNSTFQDARLNKLNAPEDDIRALNDVLKAKDICDFTEVGWAVNSTLSVVQRSLKMFLDARKREDFVLVYYTGHGLLDVDNELYLALSESDAGHPDINSLSAEWLRTTLERCRSDRQLLILDCCHSGAYIRGQTKSAPVRVAVNNQTFDSQGFGRYVLAASSKTQFALEVNGSSLYTQKIVEGLKEGTAAPSKPDISINDLEEYLAREFAVSGAPMRPTGAARKKVGELKIARNRNFNLAVDDVLRQKLVKGSEDERKSAVLDLETRAGATTVREHRVAMRDLLRQQLARDNPDREKSVIVYEVIQLALQRIEALVGDAEAMTAAETEAAAASLAKARRGSNPTVPGVGSTILRIGSRIAALALACLVLFFVYAYRDAIFKDDGALTDFERQLSEADIISIQKYFCVAQPDGVFRDDTRANIKIWRALWKPDDPSFLVDRLEDDSGRALLNEVRVRPPCDRNEHLNLLERLRLPGSAEVGRFVDDLNRIETQNPVMEARSLHDLVRQKIHRVYGIFNIFPTDFPRNEVTAELLAAIRDRLRDQPPLSSDVPRVNDPPWLLTAFSELNKGIIETVDSFNPEIMKYLDAIGLGHSSSGWDVAFVAWCLTNSGDLSKASSLPSEPTRAASYVHWGNRAYLVNDPNIPRGAVVVLFPQVTASTGHVGFYLGADKDRMTLLNGNSADSLRVTSYPKDRVRAVRWFDPSIK